MGLGGFGYIDENHFNKILTEYCYRYISQKGSEEFKSFPLIKDEFEDSAYGTTASSEDAKEDQTITEGSDCFISPNSTYDLEETLEQNGLHREHLDTIVDDTMDFKTESIFNSFSDISSIKDSFMQEIESLLEKEPEISEPYKYNMEDFSDQQMEVIDSEALNEISLYEEKPSYWSPFPKILTIEKRKTNLKPSLEYYNAPIWPYCLDDYLNEEENENAKAIDNVVTRHYGPRMREAKNRVNKSLHQIRNNPINPTEKARNKKCLIKKTKNCNDFQLTDAKVCGKCISNVKQIVEEEEKSKIPHDGLEDKVPKLNIYKDFDDFQLLLNQQDSVIAQANKALKLCLSDEKLTKSILRIEVERILLKASASKEILEKYRIKGRCQDPEDQSGFIRISNLRIRLRKYNTPKDVKSHYFCILHSGKTIHCSDLTYTKKRRKLELPDSYLFTNLPSDSKIGFQMYVIHSKAERKWSICELIKSCGSLLKSFLICSAPRSVVECNLFNCFELCGEFLISRNKDKPKEFLLENVYQRSHITEEFQYDIESGVDLKYEIFSSMLICKDETRGAWKKQWCKLEGAELKFWDNSEVEAEPNMIIDLTRSLMHRIQYAERPICFRDRSLHLRIKIEFPEKDQIYEDVYLSCDDQQVLVDWKIMMNIVLFNLQNWGCMKV